MKKITPQQYASGLLASMQERDADAIMERFIELVIKNGDRKRIPDIIRSLERIMAEQNMRTNITITTRFPLEKSKQKNIKESLQQKYKGKIQLETKIDKSILGGARVKIHDTVYDGSLKTIIQSLTKAFAS